MQKAFFLDRDGTLIVEKNYLNNLLDIQLLETVGSTLKKIQKKGFLLFVVTNQSAVARGVISEDFVLTCHEKINQLLMSFGVVIDDFFYCPHHLQGIVPYNIDCNCRKPKIGLVLQAQKKYKIDIKNSWVVGDKLIDIQLADNIGSRSVLVLTGYGKHYQSKVQKLVQTKIVEKFSDILKYI